MLEITPDSLDQFFVNNAPYLVHIDGKQVCVDPRDKGEPGDTVVVWPKKRGPVMLRRLARCKPYDRNGTTLCTTCTIPVVLAVIMALNCHIDKESP